MLTIYFWLVVVVILMVMLAWNPVGMSYTISVEEAIDKNEENNRSDKDK
jgi:E3 ubiquitin-protein ligase DOA10